MLTKEEKVLWATWAASTDIMEYAVDIVFDLSQMMACELNRLWEEGLHLSLPKGEYVVYPVKCWRVPQMFAITKIDGKFYRVTEGITEEMVVAELKRSNFSAPWVNGLEVKNILVAKWGKNWKKS